MLKKVISAEKEVKSQISRMNQSVNINQPSLPHPTPVIPVITQWVLEQSVHHTKRRVNT